MTDDRAAYNPPVDADPTAATTGDDAGADLPDLSQPERQQQPPGQALDATLDSPRTGGMGGVAGTMTPRPDADDEPS